MYCKNMIKGLNGKIKCKRLKRDIDYYLDCKKCSKTILRRNRSIKKVSKNKISVKKEIYEQVFERDGGRCRLCGSTNIQLHHIVYRSEDKKLINEPSNCIMLCVSCHKLIHSNKHYWQSKLKEMVNSGRNRIEA